MFSSLFHRFGSDGDGLLRIRNVSIALLGLVTAIGLGLIAFVSQQGWPGVVSGPIPGGPAKSRVVQNDPIVLTQTSGELAPTPGQSQGKGGGSNARVVAVNGGTTAHSTLDPSRQVGVAPTAPTHPSAQPPPGTSVPSPAAPPSPQSSAPAPVATPVSTPPSASAGAKPITSGTSKGGTPSSTGDPDEKSTDDSSGESGDKWWSKAKGGYSSGNSKGFGSKKSKGSSDVEYEDPTSKPAYTPPPPSLPDKGSKDAAETGYSGEYGKSGKNDQ